MKCTIHLELDLTLTATCSWTVKYFLCWGRGLASMSSSVVATRTICHLRAASSIKDHCPLVWVLTVLVVVLVIIVVAVVVVVAVYCARLRATTMTTLTCWWLGACNKCNASNMQQLRQHEHAPTTTKATTIATRQHQHNDRKIENETKVAATVASAASAAG